MSDWSYVEYEDQAWGVYDIGWEGSPELMIEGYKNLTIAAADPNDPPLIVCEPRNANVINFKNCWNINLSSVIMGHTIEKGTCSGGVINLEGGGDFFICNTDLYGCGAYGITSYGTYGIVLDNSVIHDCTYGCISYSDCYNAAFTNDRFEDCEGYYMLEIHDSVVSFYQCSFSGLGGDMAYVSESSYVTFEACELDEAARASLESNQAFGQQIIADWESASSVKDQGKG